MVDFLLAFRYSLKTCRGCLKENLEYYEMNRDGWSTPQHGWECVASLNIQAFEIDQWSEFALTVERREIVSKRSFLFSSLHRVDYDFHDDGIDSSYMICYNLIWKTSMKTGRRLTRRTREKETRGRLLRNNPELLVLSHFRTEIGLSMRTLVLFIQRKTCFDEH